MRMSQIQKITKRVLETNEAARSNDRLLVSLVLENMGIDTHKPFVSVFMGLNINPESITRAARMIKAEHPELRGNVEKRKEREGQMIIWAVGKGDANG